MQNGSLTATAKITVKSDFNSAQKDKISNILKDNFSTDKDTHVQIDILMDDLTALFLSELRESSDGCETVIDKKCQTSDFKSSFTTLKSVLGWDVKSYDSSQAYQTITKQNKLIHSNKMCLNDFQMFPMTAGLCEVCYTPISENMIFLSSGFKKCGHQFCNQC